MDQQNTSSVWYTQSSGAHLAVRDWAPPAGKPRGAVVIVHGLGEHSGRYERLAQQLRAWGFSVRGYDHYGHGLSHGPRGGIDHPKRLLRDLAHVLNRTITHLDPDTPLILLGHSLGGLIAAHFVAERIARVDALVLSSPALDPGLSGVQKVLVATLPHIVPHLRVSNGLPLKYLTHDVSVIDAYQADPLVHGKISARLARFIADAGPATVAKAPGWQVPTLLMWAGEDRLVAPAGSRAFAQKAPAAVVACQEFAPLYHELFNETEPLARGVYGRLREWLDQQFPVNAP